MFEEVALKPKWGMAWAIFVGLTGFG